ncbi:MAG: PorT family protein [Roseivirga sp.]|nr:PorT family protein [Roseivirga sp.]
MALAQKAPVTQHRLNSDKKILKYGFFLGSHQNSFGIKYSQAFETSPDLENLLAINSKQKAGFNLGFMVDFRLADQFSLRIVPVKIGLYQHEVDYLLMDGTVDTQLIETTRIEPGAFLRYRSIRRGNTRMYVVGGLSGSLRTGKAKETDTGGLVIRKLDIRAEVGIGLEKYFKFFKFSPELRYSRGLINVLNDGEAFYSLGIDRLVTHNFTLYFHFSD